MRFHALPAAAAALVALMLAVGCAGLHSNEAVPQIYTLASAAPPPAAASAPADAATASAVAPGGPGAPAVTVQVLRPLAAPGLDTDQIALLRDTQRLDYYAASRWPAPLPEFLQSLAIEALRASGKFRSVQPDRGAFAADEVLQIEIRRFQAEYAGEGAPVVHVQLLATLGRRNDRSVLASVSAESSAPAAENRMQAVIAAFQSAVGTALTDLAARLPP